MYPVVRKTFHNIFCPFLRVCVGIELFDNKYIIRYCLYYEMYVSRENVEKKKTTIVSIRKKYVVKTRTVAAAVVQKK